MAFAAFRISSLRSRGWWEANASTVSMYPSMWMPPVIKSGRQVATVAKKKLLTARWKMALIIGIFQLLSMIPGTSRSGATIVGALLIGVSRKVASEYTFFLAIPVMFGASLLKLVKFGFDFTGMEMACLLVGSVVAFVVSVVVIKFLMDYIKKNDFKVFGWYRIVLGALVLLYFGIIA